VTETNPAAASPLPKARSIRSRWPGLIWAVPLAALLIVSWLGIRALSQRGIDVVVTFDSANGVTPGDTKVIVQGVEAGHVTSVRVAEDGQHVDVTLRLDPRESGALNTATQFWLIGAKPSLSDLASVKAALAGLTIGMAPGTGGKSTQHFTGLSEPPVVLPGVKGTSYVLKAHTLGSINAGASISYRGQEIGKVVKTQLLDLDSFKLDIFIFAPFDKFVRTGAMFWTGTPFALSLNGDGLQAHLASANSVLQGLLQFDLPDDNRSAPESPAGTTFTLFDAQVAARQGDLGPPILYEIVFDGPAGDLAEGAAVTLLGAKVGEIRESKLAFRAPRQTPYTIATVALFPFQLGIDRADRPDAAAWRRASDDALNGLLAQGFRAQLVQSPPLIGSHAIALAMDPQAQDGKLTGGVRYPLIPSASSSGDLDGLITQAGDILGKINSIPIAAIGQSLQGLTAHLDQLSGSPQIKDSIAHLDNSLRQFDQIMTELRPKIGPLANKLDQAVEQARGMLGGDGANQDQSLADAMRQIDQAARSIRALADYIGRHPEALIGGKAKEAR
jgi:paraquat-inducible protein B